MWLPFLLLRFLFAVQAMLRMHQPPSTSEQEGARQRLAFEELLLLQLTLLLRRHISRCAVGGQTCALLTLGI